MMHHIREMVCVCMCLSVVLQSNYWSVTAVQEPIVVRQPNTFVGDGDQQMQNGVNAFDNGILTLL